LVHSVICCINHHLTHSSVSESIAESDLFFYKAKSEHLEVVIDNLNTELEFYKDFYEARLDDSSPYIESGKEESDEEDKEDDTVPHTPKRQTLVPANIFRTFTLLHVKASVEDSLFEQVNLNKDKVMDLLLSDPLNSHLLSMDRKAYRSTWEHIITHLADTAKKIAKSEYEADRLTNTEIPNASNQIMICEKNVTAQRKELDAFKECLEESRKESAASVGFYKHFQTQKEKLVADRKNGNGQCPTVSNGATFGFPFDA
jgi:hypothetical protein